MTEIDTDKILRYSLWRDQPKGLSLKGLAKGVLLPLLPLPLGGGLGGVVVIMMRDIELSSAILVISGLQYGFLDDIFDLVSFKQRKSNSDNVTKIVFIK